MAKKPQDEPTKPGTRVEEARATYDARPRKADSRANYAHVTLSSKNQITLPAAMVRLLGLHPGDELTLTHMNGEVLLNRRLYGQELWDSIHRPRRAAPELDTKEKIDEWLRIVREGGELP